MEQKKIAVMIYPHFSMQEISCLTEGLTIWYERKIDVFAASKDIMMSEDGFQVIANKTFDEFVMEDYDCLIMPGIYNPLPALFESRNIAFLKQFQNTDFLICSISSAPMLLAKAGLLENTSFTSGIWHEICEAMPYIPQRNNKHAPLVHDKNIITAIGFAFKEFALESMKALGIDCDMHMFDGVRREYTEQDLTHYMGEDNFKEFMVEYTAYEEGTAVGL